MQQEESEITMMEDAEEIESSTEENTQIRLSKNLNLSFRQSSFETIVIQICNHIGVKYLQEITDNEFQGDKIKVNEFIANKTALDAFNTLAFPAPKKEKKVKEGAGK